MKKKKLLSFAIAAALATTCCFAAIPIVSQAAEETKEYTSGDWTYTFEYYGDGMEEYNLGEGCAIVGYNGSDKDIVIPSTLEGNTVIGIGQLSRDYHAYPTSYEVFKGNKEITSVIIPDTVQFIGPRCFENCTELTNVNLGNNVRFLGNNCFTGCDSLTSIELPASMTASDAKAYFPFQFSESLKTVTIESGGVRIPNTLFYCCYGLETIIIPDGITTIGGDAFNQSSLKEITLPDSLQNIEKGAFAFTKLTQIQLTEGITKIENNVFRGCKSLIEFALPNSIESIGEYAFSGCGSKEITLPSSIYEISKYAFSGCESLERVTIHNSDQLTIRYGAFEKCSSLKEFYDYNKNTEYIDETIEYSYAYSMTYTVFGNNPSVTIHGYPGSNAEAYAAKHDIPFVSLSGEEPDDPDVEGSMYRLYNPNSGEHFYTSSATEKDNLVSVGWTSEGVAWIAPTSSNAPVYRVYNPNSGEHHYTMDSAEKDFLVGLGWNDEGIGWYSDESQGVPLYRLYNPNATGQYEAGGHHYTKDTAERDQLVAAGWQDEGIGWYGK